MRVLCIIFSLFLFYCSESASVGDFLENKGDYIALYERIKSYDFDTNNIIEKSYFSGNIQTSSASKVGGIAGYLEIASFNTSLNNNFFTGTMAGLTDVGGIVGQIYQATHNVIGIDITNHTSDIIDNLPPIEYDYVLTVCDNAKERCPILPGNHKKLHHSFPDPASAKGTEEEVAAIFASVRDEIEAYVNKFVEGLG